MRTGKAILILSITLPAFRTFAAPATGVISGVVVDDRGTPIVNASVIYRSVTPVRWAANGARVLAGPTVGSRIKTTAGGSFSIGDLPPATYHLCAYGPKDNHLGSCEWGQGTVRIDLAAGQNAQLKFVVAEGTLITFRVEDPKRQVVDLESLPTINGRVPLSGANFAVGIWAGSRYARAQLVSATGATRRYQVAIPKTANVRLYLDTPLSIADTNGIAFATRRPSATVGAGGQTEIVVNLVVR